MHFIQLKCTLTVVSSVKRGPKRRTLTQFGGCNSGGNLEQCLCK